MAKKDSKAEVKIDILEMEQGVIDFLIRGTTPLIYHRMAEKAKRELLYPKGKKNQAEKQANLKHNPIDEYRSSVHRSGGKETLLMVPTVMFKAAISSVGVDMPGAAKAQIGRVVWVEGDEIPVYGVPQLLMSVVRTTGQNRTPDIRTRAILPEWACRIRVRHMKEVINAQSLINLTSTAGIISGIGDYRQQKGKTSYGGFELVSAGDATWKRIVAKGGRKAQEAAMANPGFYDYDSEELYNWFYSEFKTRNGEKGYVELVSGAA